jgi:Leucine-rich repeat (LRR) protein
MPAIANLIQANPAIETLDLLGNDIEDADALLLVTALENNTNLKRLIFDADGVHPLTLAKIDALLSQYSATT